MIKLVILVLKMVFKQKKEVIVFVEKVMMAFKI
jgi:hypothetical protein